MTPSSSLPPQTHSTQQKKPQNRLGVSQRFSFFVAHVRVVAVAGAFTRATTRFIDRLWSRCGEHVFYIIIGYQKMRETRLSRVVIPRRAVRRCGKHVGWFCAFGVYTHVFAPGFLELLASLVICNRSRPAKWYRLWQNEERSLPLRSFTLPRWYRCLQNGIDACKMVSMPACEQSRADITVFERCLDAKLVYEHE